METSGLFDIQVIVASKMSGKFEVIRILFFFFSYVDIVASTLFSTIVGSRTPT